MREKTKITDSDRDIIQKSVAEVEKFTSGEIVPLVVQASDTYPAAHFRLGIIIAFLSGLIAYFTWHWADPVVYFYIQMLGFFAGYFLAAWTPCKRLMTTRKERAQEVHERALKAFFQHNLHSTRDRTGILIMVSLLEHRVEILADTGIHSQVETITWQKLIDEFLQKIRQDQFALGFAQCIRHSGEILKDKFPLRPDDHNELSNHLREE